MGKNERLVFFDIAKGIGILTVLFAHSGLGLRFLEWIVPYYMPMFFIVSGMLFAYNNDITSNKAIKKSKFIALKYIRLSVLIYLCYIPFGIIQNKSISFFVRNAIGVLYARKAFFWPLESEGNITVMDIGNGPLWFLSCMSLAMLIVALYLSLIELIKKVVFCIVLILLSIAFKSIPIMLPWCIDIAFLSAFFIIIGIYMFPLLIKLKDKNVESVLSGFGLIMSYYIIIRRTSLGFNYSVRNYGTYSSVLFFTFIGFIGSMMLLVV